LDAERHLGEILDKLEELTEFLMAAGRPANQYRRNLLAIISGDKSTCSWNLEQAFGTTTKLQV
jgi:hypothetical protein